MISLRPYNDKAVGIYGAGSAGLSAHAAFLAAGAHPFFWDENEKIRDRVEAAGITCTPPRDWPWDEIAVIVPGFSSRTGYRKAVKIAAKAAEHNVPVRSDVDLFAEMMARRPAGERPRIIGITGTHGKSVTGSLITHALTGTGREVYFAGTAGQPVLSLPEGGAETVYVLEILPQTMMFTRQLKCDAGILMNLTSLDIRFFKSPDQAVRATTRIFRRSEEEDALIIGVDDLISQKICTAVTASMGGFSGSENIIAVSGEATLGLGVFSIEGRVFDARSDKTVSLGSITRAPGIIGSHFNQCAAAAYAACLHLGLSAALITKGIMSWPGMPGRMFCMGDGQGAVFFDDGASTWLPSTMEALKSGEDIIWIAGGDDRQKDYARLREAGDNVIRAYFYGSAAEKLQRATRTSFDSTVFPTAAEAIAAAMADLKAGPEEADTSMPMVLFSPGCPGPDQAMAQAQYTSAVEKLLESEAA